MGDGFVKGCFNFASLEKGLLLVAEHGVGELFSSICTLFTKRHLQGKLKILRHREPRSLLSVSRVYVGAHLRQILCDLPPEGPRQTRPSARLASNFLLPRAFGRSLVSFSALLRIPSESLSGSPGLFGLPSEEAGGQTVPRWPYSPGLSTWEAGVQVDIFLETGA